MTSKSNKQDVCQIEKKADKKTQNITDKMRLYHYIHAYIHTYIHMSVVKKNNSHIFFLKICLFISQIKYTIITVFFISFYDNDKLFLFCFFFYFYIIHPHISLEILNVLVEKKNGSVEFKNLSLKILFFVFFFQNHVELVIFKYNLQRNFRNFLEKQTILITFS